MSIREQLLETFVHIPPVHALGGLTADDAVRHPAEGVHNIASILAHMEFWQSWFLARCDGNAVAMAKVAADGWPNVTADDWPALVDRFQAGLARAVAIGEDRDRFQAPITPVIEFPPLAQFTVRDALGHIAQHNSHHLGQIVTVRQVLGLWPPPFGSWTW